MASLHFFDHLEQVEAVEERAGVPNDLQKRCLAVMPILAIPTIANVPNTS